MRKHTHLAFAGAVGVSTIGMVGMMNSGLDLAFFGTGLMIGALLPDIDHAGSALGRRIPIIPTVISFVFGHRGLTHSLLFLVLLGLTRPWFSPQFYLGLMIGTISHLVGDMMTHRGIQLFYPFKMAISFPVSFKTGGVVEQVLLAIFTAWTAIKGWETLFLYL